jgi:hypothetical protein
MTWRRDITSRPDRGEHERRHVLVVAERVIGVIRSCTRPITIAAANVTVIERSRAISAAASDEITTEGQRGVVERGQVGQQIPATPASTPQPSQAAASTRGPARRGWR